MRTERGREQKWEAETGERRRREMPTRRARDDARSEERKREGDERVGEEGWQLREGGHFQVKETAFSKLGTIASET